MKFKVGAKIIVKNVYSGGNFENGDIVTVSQIGNEDEQNCYGAVSPRGATALSTLQAENEEMQKQLNMFSEFLCYMTGGLLSKTNYTAQEMVTAAEDYQQKVCGECDLRAENEKLGSELEQVKRVLAMMWYAYENKDGEAPHEYEIEARRAADKVLGPWAECMPKYLRNSQESSLCDTCAHPFDEVCKGFSDGNRYGPKAPKEPVRIMDEITEFTRDQWDWLLGRFTRKED